MNNIISKIMAAIMVAVMAITTTIATTTATAVQALVIENMPAEVYISNDVNIPTIAVEVQDLETGDAWVTTGDPMWLKLPQLYTGREYKISPADPYLCPFQERIFIPERQHQQIQLDFNMTESEVGDPMAKGTPATVLLTGGPEGDEILVQVREMETDRTWKVRGFASYLEVSDLKVGYDYEFSSIEGIGFDTEIIHPTRPSTLTGLTFTGGSRDAKILVTSNATRNISLKVTDLETGEERELLNVSSDEIWIEGCEDGHKYMISSLSSEQKEFNPVYVNAITGSVVQVEIDVEKYYHIVSAAGTWTEVYDSKGEIIAAFESDGDETLVEIPYDGIATVTWTLTGDVNSDSEVTIADAVLLQKMLLGKEVGKTSAWKAADLDHDNRVDVFDMVFMRQKLLVG